MAAIISWALILVGAVFMLLAGVGVFRMPDVFTRMHSSTKSATLGVGCVLLGAALYFNDLAIAARAIAVVVFVFVTAPVAAHMIGRAAYLSGVPLWEGTLSDDLKGRYHAKTHALASGPARPPAIAEVSPLQPEPPEASPPSDPAPPGE
jgi:multicomponent Na+:H+ antiporter subunit G